MRLALLPQVMTILVARPERRYNEAATSDCDVVVDSLAAATTILAKTAAVE